MKDLEIIYFYEQGQIYPFLKEQEQSNKDYYNIKNLKDKNTNNKEQVLQGIRIRKYLELLNKGHSYQEINEKLLNSIEYLSSGRDYNGINDIFEEKDALKIANTIIDNKKISKKKQLLKRNTVK